MVPVILSLLEYHIGVLSLIQKVIEGLLQLVLPLLLNPVGPLILPLQLQHHLLIEGRDVQ